MAVYFIRAVGSDRVKIGHARNVARRVEGFATGCPFPLETLRVIDGGKAVERWVHRRFSERRIHLEWFSFCDEMLTIEPPSLADERATQPKNAGYLRVLAKLGGAQTRLMELSGCKQGTVSAWARSKWGIPQRRVPMIIENAGRVGIQLSVGDFYPNIFARNVSAA